MGMAIKNLKIVSIPVRDQEAAKRFYHKVMGFEVLIDQPFMSGARWIELAPAGAQTTITLVTWFENMQPGGVTGLVLETDDIEVDAARLAERGAALSAIQDAPWGRYVTFSDPDGNGWVLQQSLSRSSEE
jgi:catechol 2,3-dioxygenase-like lactoylglutathione lyase family enzyme